MKYITIYMCIEFLYIICLLLINNYGPKSEIVRTKSPIFNLGGKIYEC